jgi:hypothetical protein
MIARVIMLLIFLVTSTVQPAEVLSLPDIYLCPEILCVDGPEIIFNYNLTFYVYGLNPFRLKTKFGREGEGPGEFKSIILLSTQPKHFLVYSLGKMSVFSRPGHLIREFKVPLGRHLVPAGNSYIGYAMEPSDRIIHISVNLYGSDGKKRMSLLKIKHFFQLNNSMDLIRLASAQAQRAHYQVYEKRIFVQGENNTIHVFNFKGRLDYIIHLEYPKLVVDAAKQDEILEILHRRFKSDRVRQLIKINGFFPKNFPARRFVIDGGQIYIPTFRRKGEQTQFVILDLKGKILKKVFLPFSEFSILTPYTYTIYNQKLYQFVENEELEHMEIHIHKIPD